MSCGRMSLTVPIQTPTPTDSRQTARHVHVGILAVRLPLTHWRSAFVERQATTTPSLPSATLCPIGSSFQIGNRGEPSLYRILTTSRNVRLLLERNDVLAMAGFSVVSPRYPEQAPDLAAQEHVDAVIIGHSIDPEVRRFLIAQLRRLSSKCVICFVYQAPDREGEPLADVSLDVTKGPEPLILALQERLPKAARKAS